MTSWSWSREPRRGQPAASSSEVCLSFPFYLTFLFILFCVLSVFSFVKLLFTAVPFLLPLSSRLLWKRYFLFQFIFLRYRLSPCSLSSISLLSIALFSVCFYFILTRFLSYFFKRVFFFPIGLCLSSSNFDLTTPCLFLPLFLSFI